MNNKRKKKETIKKKMYVGHIKEERVKRQSERQNQITLPELLPCLQSEPFLKFPNESIIYFFCLN
jgi:hypothetical protein